ncbi:MAG: LuxR C-terminal-related transcriptional regulator [Gaiellales bacterium]
MSSAAAPEPGRTDDDLFVAAAVRSGAAMFTFDVNQRVLTWNAAAERATGVPADEVVGRPCWQVLCAKDRGGGLVCHTGCSFHRLLRENWPVAPATLVVRTATGFRPMRVPMLALRERSVFAALLLEVDDIPPEREPRPPAHCALTPRQTEILGMLAEGKAARAIAAELHLSEMTVRNHIRGILRELGCTSQLSAVAAARRLGLV